MHAYYKCPKSPRCRLPGAWLLLVNSPNPKKKQKSKILTTEGLVEGHICHFYLKLVSCIVIVKCLFHYL